jgi:hypothetical protein
MDLNAEPGHSSAPLTAEKDSGSTLGRAVTGSISSEIAAANARLPNPVQAKSPQAQPRFPGEDGGHSLAEMAQRDLDAALQLLAERAQYITQASGAAIALRRGEHSDMLCRASAGSNAPELGTLLSMEYGLSGESVRTRKPLRCDDAENDSRVNREGCRELGIASVAVMPIVSDGHVLGVFELFSCERRAFDERDFSALQRLGEMVETAVRHAVAAQSGPALDDPQIKDPQIKDKENPSTAIEIRVPERSPALSAPSAVPMSMSAEATVSDKAEKAGEPKSEPAPSPQKPLFWSAAMRAAANTGAAQAVAPAVTAPPVLRQLRKCEACGFPVSQERTLCVECEEKRWRGQPLPQPAGASAPDQKLQATKSTNSISISSSAPHDAVSEPSRSEATATQTLDDPQAVTAAPAEESSTVNESTLLMASTAGSGSWFAANKFVLGALLAIVIVISIVAWLR